ncbi:hypothetical protein C8Q80DRAFT_1273751 [Daedaleopsis nitida]|nr:hypothetical protein C8Q80DRAFT_1273751 [Daedaleopsis nitida]
MQEHKGPKQTVPKRIVEATEGEFLNGAAVWGDKWPIYIAPQGAPTSSATPIQPGLQTIFPAVKVTRKEPATRQRARRQPAPTYDGSVQVIKPDRPANPRRRPKRSTRRGGQTGAQATRRSSTKAVGPDPSMGEEPSDTTSPSPPLHEPTSSAPIQLSPASIQSAPSLPSVADPTPASLSEQLSDISSTARTGDGTALAFADGRGTSSSQQGPKLDTSSESASGTAQEFLGSAGPSIEVDTSRTEHLPGTSGDGHASPHTADSHSSLPVAYSFQVVSAPPFQSTSLSPSSSLSDNAAGSQETRQAALNDVAEIGYEHYPQGLAPAPSATELVHAFAPSLALAPVAYRTRAAPSAPAPAPSSSPHYHMYPSQVSLVNQSAIVVDDPAYQNNRTIFESPRPSYTAPHYSQTLTNATQTFPASGAYPGGHPTGPGVFYSPAMPFSPWLNAPSLAYNSRNDLVYNTQYSGYIAVPPRSIPARRAYYQHAPLHVSVSKPYHRSSENDVRAADNAMAVSSQEHGYGSVASEPANAMKSSSNSWSSHFPVTSSYMPFEPSPVANAAAAAVSDQVYHQTERSTTYVERVEPPHSLAPTPPSGTYYHQSSTLVLGSASDASTSTTPDARDRSPTYVDSESSTNLWTNGHIPNTTRSISSPQPAAGSVDFGSYSSSESSMSGGELLPSTPSYNHSTSSDTPLITNFEQGVEYMLVDQVAVDQYRIDTADNNIGRDVGVVGNSSPALHEENPFLDRLRAVIFEDLESSLPLPGPSLGRPLHHASLVMDTSEDMMHGRSAHTISSPYYGKYLVYNP